MKKVKIVAKQNRKSILEFLFSYNFCHENSVTNKKIGKEGELNQRRKKQEKNK